MSADRSFSLLFSELSQGPHPAAQGLECSASGGAQLLTRQMQEKGTEGETEMPDKFLPRDGGSC